MRFSGAPEEEKRPLTHHLHTDRKQQRFWSNTCLWRHKLGVYTKSILIGVNIRCDKPITCRRLYFTTHNALPLKCRNNRWTGEFSPALKQLFVIINHSGLIPELPPQHPWRHRKWKSLSLLIYIPRNTWRRCRSSLEMMIMINIDRYENVWFVLAVSL